MKIVAERLKALREAVNFSQSRIAEMLGTTQASVTRYEKDQTAPPLAVLLWYANYFDVSLDYIFGRTDQPQGKHYEYKPKVMDELAKTNKEVRQFVNMCFDPKSPINDRLKDALIKMLEGDNP